MIIISIIQSHFRVNYLTIAIILTAKKFSAGAVEIFSVYSAKIVLTSKHKPVSLN